MLINGKQIIDPLVAKYPEAVRPINRWITLTEASNWQSFVEVKNTFNATDYVAPYTVFDIGGNKWRLIAVIDFGMQLVVISHALTHHDYDKGKWK
jgi:mRNA interferase HigB